MSEEANNEEVNAAAEAASPEVAEEVKPLKWKLLPPLKKKR